MDFIMKKKITNLLKRYNIVNSSTNFNKLAEVLDQKDFVIYQVILKLAPLCIITHENDYCLKFEIEVEKNKELLEDIQVILYKSYAAPPYRF